MKEQVKVLINSKKEAKQVKAILKGLGEGVAYNFYEESILVDESECFYCKEAKEWLCHKSSSTAGLKEISIRDLIILITKPEEEKVFVMTSEEGVRLYHMGSYHWVSSDENGVWRYREQVFNISAEASNPAYCYPKYSKAFSTKEAAEKWIEEANHPKYKSVQLYHGMEARIYHHNSEVAIMDGGHHIHTMTFGDIHDIRSIINQD